MTTRTITIATLSALILVGSGCVNGGTEEMAIRDGWRQECENKYEKMKEPHVNDLLMSECNRAAVGESFEKLRCQSGLTEEAKILRRSTIEKYDKENVSWIATCIAKKGELIE
jgi:hypothetical protein